MGAQTLPGKPKKSPFEPKGEFWTDEEIIALPDDQGQRYELHDGEVICMSPTGAEHEVIIQRLNFALASYLAKRNAGQLFGGQIGCRLTPWMCYSPDLSFVSKERLPSICPEKKRFLRASPDLIIEVLSPSDSRRTATKKLVGYFKCGARLAWVIDPRRWEVLVYRTASDFSTLERDGQLSGESVLPGFKYPLSALFAPSFV